MFLHLSNLLLALHSDRLGNLFRYSVRRPNHLKESIVTTRISAGSEFQLITLRED